MSIEKKHGNNLLIAAVFCKKDAAYQASRKTGNGGFDFSDFKTAVAST